MTRHSPELATSPAPPWRPSKAKREGVGIYGSDSWQAQNWESWQTQSWQTQAVEAERLWEVDEEEWKGPYAEGWLAEEEEEEVVEEEADEEEWKGQYVEE